jgi:FMN phosphatase YigB (HAD superfamily)
MTGSHIRAVAFDCFGTLLHIGAPTNPWRSLLSEAHRQPGGHMLDPRREPIPTIEAFAAACGTKFRPEWRRDLDRELASIELVPEALAVLGRLRAAGFWFALASNLASAYVEPALRLLGGHVDVTCLSCDADVRAVKPEGAFFAALQNRFGLPAEDILMVGDSLTSDVRGAGAAGLPALHLVPGGAPGPGRISRLADVPALFDLA